MARSNPKNDRYHAQMPHIPGVPSGRSASLRTLGALTAAVGVLLLAGLALAIRHDERSPGPTPAVATIAQPDPPASPVADPPPDTSDPGDTNEIAPIGEMAHPWSSKQFTFVRPLTHESVAGIAIRLPSNAGGSSSSYWAFSRTEPFGTCQLQYISNLAVIASQYGYAATHPMVVDPCTQTVFDPLRMGQRADGAWLRGEIVQGGGLRPPMAIQVSVRKNVLYADRME